MAGILWFCFWQIIGLCISRVWFCKKRVSVRIWLGSTVGTILSMWMPVLFAFAAGFSVMAHVYAVLAGVMAFAGGYVLLRKKGFPQPAEEDCRGDKPLLWLLGPLFIIWLFLVWSHTLRDVDGGMYTGQCTYGDMAMHLGFITSLGRQQFFPPYYSILPGARISYPFFCDSVSASLYVLGTPLRWAYMIPMFFAFAQFCAGFWFLALEVCKKQKAAVLAFLFFFLNGGLGMIYFFRDYSLHDLFTGFYKTPTNLVDKGMRWVNVIADMLLPQRATLFGWAALSAALYLLYRAVFTGDEKCFLPAGVIGGLLPMIHTHSFLSLGLFAACWMVYTAFRDRLSPAWFRNWLCFGLTAVALAAPQLLIWTFRSVKGNQSFLRINFDWVNGGEENWFWFWLKNVGPLFIITPIAFIFADKERRAVFSGAILIFVLCELVVFQPNVYDNNKLLYVGYFFCCFLCADSVTQWLDKIKNASARRAALWLLLFACTNAAVFTIGREIVSGIPKYGYQLFSADEVSAAQYILDSVPADSVFLTDDNHDNPVAVLTGRNIVCGSSSYLYYHGLDYTDQQQKAERMLTDPMAFERYKDVFGVDYVYMGYYERAMMGNISDYLAANYTEVFAANGISIYSMR